jgi:hypothetical protein
MTNNCLKTIVVCIKGGYYTGLGKHGKELVPYDTDGGTIASPASRSTFEVYGDIFARAYADGGEAAVNGLGKALERGDLAIKQTGAPVLFDDSIDEIKVVRTIGGELDVVDPTIS